MNKLAILAASLLIFFGAALWYLAATDLTGFLRSQVITQASLITKQQVDVKQVTLALEHGDITLENFTISDTHSSENALSIKKIRVKADTSTINAPVIIVESVNFDKLHANITFSADGDNNFKQITQQIQSQFNYIDSYTPEEFKLKKKSSSKTAPATKMQILSINATNLTLTVDLQAVNGEVLTIEIPNLALAAIGRDAPIDANFIGTNITDSLIKAIISLADIHYENAIEKKPN
ncbi:MAG: hypothetical protein P8M49_11600 [Thalassotalea sp.]|nr:hypothetical protein [Thalassotalea sp.]MDG2394149.1 hypothetical protein [Thalassotalea sp.]